MKLLTEAEQVRTAAERWREQHELPAGWVTLQDGRSSEAVYKALCGIGNHSSAARERIEYVVGDDRLVHPHRCTECGLTFWRCVEFPGGVVLCAGCMCRGLSAALGVSGPRV